MFRAILQRLVQGIIVLFVLFTGTFFLTKALPYGPFQQEKAIPDHIRAKVEAYYGLDQPTGVQYLRRLENFLKGDPGLSLRLEGRPVMDILSEAFPTSLQLGLAAMVVALAIGIPLGTLAAARKNSLIDFGAMALAMTGICLPSFVIGPILAEIFGRGYKLLPAVGWEPFDARYWILPAITLGLSTAAYLSRLTRAGMLDTLSQDFVRTARAKGVPGPRILVRHCLRGGLIPAVAFVGPAFAGLISGSVVVESIFHIPGIGQHFIKAIETGDEPVILASVMLYGTLIIIANFLTDVVSVWLNPRLRKAAS